MAKSLIFLSVIEVRATHGQEGFVQVAPEFPTIPYPLNVPAFKGVSGRMVIRGNVNSGGLANDPVTGKAYTTGADRKLIGGTS